MKRILSKYSFILIFIIINSTASAQTFFYEREMLHEYGSINCEVIEKFENRPDKIETSADSIIRIISYPYDGPQILNEKEMGRRNGIFYVRDTSKVITNPDDYLDVRVGFWVSPTGEPMCYQIIKGLQYENEQEKRLIKEMSENFVKQLKFLPGTAHHKEKGDIYCKIYLTLNFYQ